MKAKFIILLAIILQLNCTTKENSIEGVWLLTKQQHKPNAGAQPTWDGLLFSFENGEVTCKTPFSDTLFHLNYVIEDDFIKIDSVAFGKILNIYEDSLIIEKDTNTFDMHFLRLSDNAFDETDKKELDKALTDYAWKLDTDLANYTLYANTSKWLGEGGYVKTSAFKKETTDRKYWETSEKWILKEFEGRLILMFSNHGMELNHLFEVTKISENEIEGRYANSESWYVPKIETVSLKRIPNASATEIQKAKKHLVGTWETKEIINPSEKKIDDVIGISVISKKDKYLDEEWFFVNGFTEGKFRLELKANGEYAMYIGKRLLRSGQQWKVADNLKLLYFDYGISEQHFFEIKSLTENEFHVEKVERVKLDSEHLNSNYNLSIEQILIKIEN